MFTNGTREQIKQVLRECLNVEDARNPDLPISAALIANCAVAVIDPEDVTPTLVKYSAIMNLRQEASRLLSGKFDPVGDLDDGQVEMFEGLQDRYPAKRDKECFYVPRMQLTLEERHYNIDRMSKEIATKSKHRDCFKAETDSLEASGFFEEMASK